MLIRVASHAASVHPKTGPTSPESQAPSPEVVMNDVIDFIQSSRDRYVAELTQYLSIPSISAIPEHKVDVRRCADYTAAK